MFSIKFNDETGELTFQPWRAGAASMCPDLVDDMIKEIHAAKAQHDLFLVLSDREKVESFQKLVEDWINSKLEWMKNLDSTPQKGVKPFKDRKRGDLHHDTWAKGYYDGIMSLAEFVENLAKSKPSSLLREE